MFGFFNACVDGGRMRTDVRLNDQFLVYGAFGYFLTRARPPAAATIAVGP